MSDLTRTGRQLGRRDGPVFISYRQSDGTRLANFVETYLRCGGIIPWRDLVDLPAGEVARSVQDAMEDGISAGILIATPELAYSEFVRKHEVPLLQKMLHNDPRRFRLYIVNTIRDPVASPSKSGFDVGAPDQLLGFTAQARTSYRQRRINKGLLTQDRAENRLLRNAKQYGLLTATQDAPAKSELRMLLRDLLRHRLRARHLHLLDKDVKIAVQTRPDPSSVEASRSASRNEDLVIRMRQNPENQLPAELDYRCLQETLPVIIDAIHSSGATTVSFSGGCHPSIAWTLGAALPDARGLKEFSWVDAYDSEAVWRSQLTSSIQSSISMQIESSDPVTIHADKVPTSQEMRTLLAGMRTDKDIVVHLSTGRYSPEPLAELGRRLDRAPTVVLNATGPLDAAGRAWIPAEDGGKLAQILGQVLRNLAEVGQLHLSISGSIALAALTARHCNTISVQFYEMAHYNDGRARKYIRVCETTSGNKSPLSRVHSQGRPSKEITHLINLTPHDVTLYREDVPLQVWERLDDARHRIFNSEHSIPQNPLLVDGVEVPHTRVNVGKFMKFPDDKEGTGFIVSRFSAAAAHRDDFFFPYDEVCNDQNVLLGYRGLGSFSSCLDDVRPYLQWLPNSENTL